MKNLIITLGIVLLMSTFAYFQKDCNLLVKEVHNLKYVADEAAATGALQLNCMEYSKGRIVYDYDRSIAKIQEIIKLNFMIDNLRQGNYYWRDGFKFDVFFFDESMVMRHYDSSSGLNTSKSYNIGDRWTNPDTDRDYEIERPMVVVNINAGSATFDLDILDMEFEVIRSSYYEYVGY